MNQKQKQKAIKKLEDMVSKLPFDRKCLLLGVLEERKQAKEVGAETGDYTFIAGFLIGSEIPITGILKRAVCKEATI